MAKLGEVCKVSASTKMIDKSKAWLLNLDMVEQQTGRVVEYNFVGEDGLNGSITQFDTENVLYSKLRPNLNKVVLPERNGFVHQNYCHFVQMLENLTARILQCFFALTDL